jgi:hypothetical protein
MVAKKTKTPAVGSLILLAEVTPIASGKLMKEPTDNLSLIEQTQAYCVLKKVGEAVEGRIKELREPLMAVAEASGVVTDTGNKEHDVDGSRVVVEHRKSKLPDSTAVTKLLQEKGIPLMEAFDEVKSLQLNPSKLDFLVQTGKLTAEQLTALCGETLALRVYPSKFLKEAVGSLGLSAAKPLNE